MMRGTLLANRKEGYCLMNEQRPHKTLAAVLAAKLQSVISLWNSQN